MAAKLEIHESAGVKEALFWCPGCRSHHSFRFVGPEPCWSWNQDMDRPTFSPSLLIDQSRTASRCHLFLRDGQLQFLPDCWHDLAGKTVPLEALEEE